MLQESILSLLVIETIADNISVDDSHPFEDWWCHPDLVPSHCIDDMLCVDGKTKKAEDYMLIPLTVMK